MADVPRLIIGCGYLGSRVAQRWRASGQELHVVTRSPQRARELTMCGYRPIVADVTRDAGWSTLPRAETVLFAVGYDAAAGPTQREVYVDGLARVLAHLPAETGRLIYVSSTGVYGQVEGEWVDENTPCRPERAGGQACLDAEGILRSDRLGARSVILRMAGIYGPGRVPRQRELLSREPILARADGYLNLIHVDDAARIVEQVESLAIAEPQRLPLCYVVSDGCPVPRRDYYGELARLLGAPAPRFGTLEPGDLVGTRAGSDKRVNNAKLAADLSLQLAFPTYRQGLAAIVAAT